MQPTLTESAQDLLRQQEWAAALAAGQVTAYVEGGDVVVRATRDLAVPVTGAGNGRYADERSGWVGARRGATVRIPVTAG